VPTERETLGGDPDEYDGVDGLGTSADGTEAEPLPAVRDTAETLAK
jgi:hypothetical protein